MAATRSLLCALVLACAVLHVSSTRHRDSLHARRATPPATVKKTKLAQVTTGGAPKKDDAALKKEVAEKLSITDAAIDKALKGILPAACKPGQEAEMTDAEISAAYEALAKVKGPKDFMTDPKTKPIFEALKSFQTWFAPKKTDLCKLFEPAKVKEICKKKADEGDTACVEAIAMHEYCTPLPPKSFLEEGESIHEQIEQQEQSQAVMSTMFSRMMHKAGVTKDPVCKAGEPPACKACKSEDSMGALAAMSKRSKCAGACMCAPSENSKEVKSVQSAQKAQKFRLRNMNIVGAVAAAAGFGFGTECVTEFKNGKWFNQNFQFASFAVGTGNLGASVAAYLGIGHRGTNAVGDLADVYKGVAYTLELGGGASVGFASIGGSAVFAMSAEPEMKKTAIGDMYVPDPHGVTTAVAAATAGVGALSLPISANVGIAEYYTKPTWGSQKDTWFGATVACGWRPFKRKLGKAAKGIKSIGNKAWKGTKRVFGRLRQVNYVRTLKTMCATLPAPTPLCLGVLGQ